MKARLISLLAAVAAAALVPATAYAQRQAATPEQRIDRLERQVQQMQQQVFPRGRPADTAGFAGDPAASQSSVVTLDQRADALERQMSDLLRQQEENGNRLRTIEADLTKLRSDQDQRISAIEQRLNQTPAQVETPAPSTAPKPKPPAARPTAAETPAPASNETAEGGPVADPAEDAYSEAFHMWEGGQYEQAITALRAFTAAYPKHRRVSYANNLVGRALLDKGEARAAAEAFLANYRNNPAGERAPDSLYYLGQSLTKLGQVSQACKAYAELDAVYGAKIRPDLKQLETTAKTQAQCS